MENAAVYGPLNDRDLSMHRAVSIV